MGIREIMIQWHNNERIELRLKRMSSVVYRAHYYRGLKNRRLTQRSILRGTSVSPIKKSDPLGDPTRAECQLLMRPMTLF